MTEEQTNEPARTRPFVWVALALTLGLLAFYKFGRPIWVPVKNKVFGKKTVEQVVSSLEGRMSSVFPDLDTLIDQRELALLAFKQEQRLELWKQGDDGWRHIKNYPFTAMSGVVGPKLKEGDGQIPEGIYQVKFLNPNSSYHLSLQIDYPNEFDRDQATRDGRSNLGDHIFIHGKDVTIGCIPIGDSAIEEVFYLVARNRLENTRVIIAPYDMRVRKLNLDIESIDWENELYQQIQMDLAQFGVATMK